MLHRRHMEVVAEGVCVRYRQRNQRRFWSCDQITSCKGLPLVTHFHQLSPASQRLPQPLKMTPLTKESKGSRHEPMCGDGSGFTAKV